MARADIRVIALALAPGFGARPATRSGPARRQHGVWRSVDGGATWAAVNTGLTNQAVRSLAVAADGTLFAGTTAGGIFRSTNGGGNWTQVGAGVTESDIITLAASPNYTTDGTIFAGTWGGILISTDRGLTWTQRADFGNSVNDIAVLPSTPLTLFAAGDDQACQVNRRRRELDKPQCWFRVPVLLPRLRCRQTTRPIKPCLPALGGMSAASCTSPRMAARPGARSTTVIGAKSAILRCHPLIRPTTRSSWVHTGMVCTERQMMATTGANHWSITALRRSLSRRQFATGSCRLRGQRGRWHLQVRWMVAQDGRPLANLTQLGNYRNGVNIANGAHDNMVGGAAAGAGNLISNNGLGRCGHQTTPAQIITLFTATESALMRLGRQHWAIPG